MLRDIIREICLQMIHFSDHACYLDSLQQWWNEDTWQGEMRKGRICKCHFPEIWDFMLIILKSTPTRSYRNLFWKKIPEFCESRKGSGFPLKLSVCVPPPPSHLWLKKLASEKNSRNKMLKHIHCKTFNLLVNRYDEYRGRPGRENVLPEYHPSPPPPPEDSLEMQFSPLPSLWTYAGGRLGSS